jgi:hypothetical protein
VVILNIAPNTGGPRSGTATIADQVFSITEGGGACGALDVTATIGPLVRRSGYTPVFTSVYDFTQNITIGPGPIPGPLYLVLVGEPTHYGFPHDSGLLNPPTNLVTTCFSSAGDYLIPVSGGLTAGQFTSLGLEWYLQGFGAVVQYSIKVLVGEPSR